MKIQILLQGMIHKPSGSFRVAYEYANHLSRLHCQITIGIIILDNGWVGWRGKFNTTLREVQALLGWERNWFTLDSKIRKQILSITDALQSDSDILIVNDWKMAEALQKVYRGEKPVFYIVHHDEAVLGKYPRDRVEATLNSPFFKVAVSRNTYQYVCGVTPERVFYVPNGIDHSVFRLIQPIRIRTRMICMAFSPKAIKDPDTALRALTYVDAQVPDLAVTFFGVSEKPRSIPIWIRYERNPTEAKLVNSIYNQSSIFLCTSVLEGFSFPVAEAMACGCAVVSTDCGGISDFAVHEKTAYISPVADAESLAANMLKMVQNDEERVRIATQGQGAIASFTWSRSACELHSHMQESLK